MIRRKQQQQLLNNKIVVRRRQVRRARISDRRGRRVRENGRSNRSTLQQSCRWRGAIAGVRAHSDDGSATPRISSWSVRTRNFPASGKTKKKNWRSKNVERNGAGARARSMTSGRGVEGEGKWTSGERARVLECPRQRERARYSSSPPTADWRGVGGGWRGNDKKSFDRLCVGGVVVACRCALVCVRVVLCPARRCVRVCVCVRRGGAWACERATDRRNRAQTGDECVNCVCARQVERGGGLCVCALSGRCRTERAAMISPRAKVSLCCLLNASRVSTRGRSARKIGGAAAVSREITDPRIQDGWPWAAASVIPAIHLFHCSPVLVYRTVDTDTRLSRSSESVRVGLRLPLFPRLANAHTLVTPLNICPCCVYNSFLLFLFCIYFFFLSIAKRLK